MTRSQAVVVLRLRAVERYIQVLGAPESARTSATRMAGMRKNQSLITAAARSPGLASGRLRR
jgi:hypothetical protein